MKRYIGFFRGINVGGQKKVPMSELREVLTGVGLQDVKTYIQSGNIVFDSNAGSIEELNALIDKSIFDRFRFKVPVLLKSVSEVVDILAKNPYIDQEDLSANKVYFVLLFTKPTKESIKGFEQEEYSNEKFKVSQNCVYLYCGQGYGKAKLNNNLVERKLKVEATTRNYRTMTKMVGLAV